MWPEQRHRTNPTEKAERMSRAFSPDNLCISEQIGIRTLSRGNLLQRSLWCEWASQKFLWCEQVKCEWAKSFSGVNRSSVNEADATLVWISQKLLVWAAQLWFDLSQKFAGVNEQQVPFYFVGVQQKKSEVKTERALHLSNLSAVLLCAHKALEI